MEFPDIDLLAQRVLRQESVALTAAMVDAVNAFKEPSTDSPRQRDKEWVAGRAHEELLEGAFNIGAEAVATLLMSADDHRQAVAELLESDRMIPLPAMTCARAVHEAVVKICWLTEPGISSEERLARAAAHFLGMIQGGIPVLAQLPKGVLESQEHIKRVAQARQGGFELFEKIGVDVTANKNTGQALNVRYGSAVANVVPKITDLSAKYTPQMHFIWAMNSGAAHSNPWLINGMSGPWSTVVTSILAPLLDMSDALVDSLMGYVGLSTEELHRRTHQRRISLMRAIGNGGELVDHTTYRRRDT
ncbi:hypothetical protein [Kocuria sp. CPCC 205261]|uniref:hypothetical protein n=1 Tax=Kocuria sp. CPCC 205261 TaxID=3073554 RepID=UPI0034D49C92